MSRFFLQLFNNQPKRSNPAVVLGKDTKTQKPTYFAVYFLNNEDGAKIALSAGLITAEVAIALLAETGLEISS